MLEAVLLFGGTVNLIFNWHPKSEVISIKKVFDFYVFVGNSVIY